MDMPCSTNSGVCDLAESVLSAVDAANEVVRILEAELLETRQKLLVITLERELLARRIEKLTEPRICQVCSTRE